MRKKGFGKRTAKRTVTKKNTGSKAPKVARNVRRPRGPRGGKRNANKELIGMLIAAGVLGAVEAKGWDQKLPKLPMIGTAGTAALAIYAYQHFIAKSKKPNPLLDNAFNALAAIAAYRVGVQAAVSLSSEPAADKTKTAGDFGQEILVPAAPAVSGIADAPAAAQLPGRSNVVGVDPALLSKAAEILEGISSDDDVSGDDDDISGDEVSGDEVSGDDEDEDDDDDDDSISGDDE